MEQEYLRSLVKLYDRDITKLFQEIDSYQDDASLWIKDGKIHNPAGNLALHLCGNLQHYIGKVLGNIAYVRNRPLEFSATGLSRAEVLSEIIKTKEAVLAALLGIKPAQLLETYPEKVFDYDISLQHFLNHLLAHLGYHLGQINYHRRLLTS